MKITRIFCALLAVLAVHSAHSQALSEINFNYRYDGSAPLTIDWRGARQSSNWLLFATVQLNDTIYHLQDYSFQWETRSTLSDKVGVPLAQAPAVTQLRPSMQQFKMVIAIPATPQLVVAHVYNNVTKGSWWFYTSVDPNDPTNLYLASANESGVTKPYLSVGEEFMVNGLPQNTPLIASYYNDKFPAAVPAFSEGMAKVGQKIATDSVFTIASGQRLNFTRAGLYLIQQDTTLDSGIAFRVEDGYPKIKYVKDLSGPFIYICSKDEYDHLRMAGNDKKQFDKNVLEITRDRDRAVDLMRNYFRRVEAANRFFTSYKEGWRTDRGMIYLIFGPPVTVHDYLHREVWSYGTITFEFVRSATLFDPDNYVLIRQSKYMETVNEKIDLIRGSRF